jgi:hypothetical protein
VCGSSLILQSSSSNFEAALKQEFDGLEGIIPASFGNPSSEGKIVRVNRLLKSTNPTRLSGFPLCAVDGEVSASTKIIYDDISIALNTFLQTMQKPQDPEFTPLEIERYQKMVEEK